MNDCSSCPSRLQGEDVRAFYGASFGPDVDACATFGHVLGKPGLDASAVKKVQVAFARDCKNHGMERPVSRPEFPEARVCAPSPAVFGRINPETGFFEPFALPDSEEQALVKSCKACANFVPENVVAEELGWYLGACAATGRLLIPKRLIAEPKSCGHARPGPNTDSTEGMALRDEYNDAFSFGGVKVTGATYESRGFIEPTEYPTDREVSAGESSDGIRAWRRVFSNDGSGRYVDLPIFEPSYFSEHEQGRIPRSGDDAHPEYYVDHQNLVYTVGVLTMELDSTPCLIGAAGTGKTEFFMHLAWLMCLPFDRISITRSSEVDDLAGKYLFTDGETRWVDGRVTKAWRTPGVLVLDEPNVGPDEVWQFIRPLTDNAKQLVLDQKDGEQVARNDWRFAGLAMNPPHDLKYVGTNEISDADGNRLAVLAVGLPPDDVERKVLIQACLNDGYELPLETLDKIMAIAGDIRAAVDDETVNASWGLRPQIAVARSTRWFGLRESYGLALANRLDPDGAENIFRIVKGYEA